MTKRATIRCGVMFCTLIILGGWLPALEPIGELESFVQAIEVSAEPILVTHCALGEHFKAVVVLDRNSDIGFFFTVIDRVVPQNNEGTIGRSYTSVIFSFHFNEDDLEWVNENPTHEEDLIAKHLLGGQFRLLPAEWAERIYQYEAASACSEPWPEGINSFTKFSPQ